MDILGLGLIQINDWLLLIILIFTAAYYYYTWKYNYFISRGIPGPKPVPFFGTLLPVMREGSCKVDLDHAKKYGKIYGGFEGRNPVLNISDQEIIKQIFIKDHVNFMNRRPPIGSSPYEINMLSNAENEHWKSLRSTLSPTFSTGKLRIMMKQINECAQELVENLAKEADTGKAVEIKEYAGAFTMDVIASTAFGLKVNSQKDKNNEFVRMAKKAFNFSFFNPIFIIIFFFPFLLPLLRFVKFAFFSKDVVDFFSDITNRTMDSRKESKEKRTDFMQLMLNAHKEETTDVVDEQNDHDKQFLTSHGNVVKKSLSKIEIVSQSILFFLAGYETTATSISFLAYLLALNPDIQEKLYQEIVDVAGDKEIDYNLLHEMNLLDMCCQETLRLYPPGIRLERTCNRTTEINGVKIEKGMLVSVPVYALHHDPKIWPEPEKFNPYRFTKEEKAKHSLVDWLPFGAGPRNCIALRLALAELKVAAVYLVRNYKILRCEKTEVPIKLAKVALMKAENGVWVELRKR